VGSGRGVHGKENPRKVLSGRSSDRTRADSPRQLPTDHDYAVSTREYQSDQPSRKLPRPRLALPPKDVRKKQLLVVDGSFHIRTGTIIRLAADGRTPLSEIVRSRICPGRSVDPDTAYRDAREFVEAMAQQGILSISSSPLD
jgi:hypothetical protein